MLYARNTYRSALPSQLNSYQVQSVSELIHEEVSLAIAPFAQNQFEAKPHYHAMGLVLESVKAAIDQLALAHTQRKYKSVGAMFGVGGEDGLQNETTQSQQKRKFYTERQMLTRRFRSLVTWFARDTLVTAKTEAARLLDRIVNLRMDHFESLSYAESLVEFKYLFEAIDENPEASQAVEMMELGHIYQGMKSAHQSFRDLIFKQVKTNARREAAPKIVDATRDLRHGIRVLLTNLHFDTETGDKTFEPVLARIDELIDGVNSVADLRLTRAKRKADEKKESSVQDDAENKVAAMPDKDAKLPSELDASAPSDSEPSGKDGEVLIDMIDAESVLL